MPKTPPSERSGLLRIAVAATIWGSIPVLVRAVDASSFVIVFWRVVFAAATLGTYLAMRGRLREVAAMPSRRRWALVAMGALLTLNWVLFFTALQLTDVAVAVLLAYLGPVFVAALNPLFSRQAFDRSVLLPLALALAGTAMIVGPAEVRVGSASQLLGALLAFTSAITYSVLVLNAKRLVQGVPATVYMLVEYGTAAVLLLPFALTSPPPDSSAEWASLAALGVVNTALTGFLFLSALRITRPDRAAILTYAEPVSAVVFAALFLGEAVTATTLIGGLAVVGAGVLVAKSRTGVGVEGPPLLFEQAVETDPEAHNG